MLIFLFSGFLYSCCLAILPWSPLNLVFDRVEKTSIADDQGWVRVYEMPEGFINCGAKDDLFQWEKLELTPNPPQRNKNATGRVVGTLLEDITGDAKVEYLVKFGSLPIVRDTVDACETLHEYPSLPQCPLKAGYYDVSYGELIPLATPMGTYTIQAKGYVGDGEGRRQIFCIEGVVVIKLFNPELNLYREGTIEDIEEFIQAGRFDWQ
jgi:hypothetical protein